MREYTVREYDKDDYDIGRDSMTDADAIARLESINRGWLPDYNYTGDESDYEAYLNHVAMWKAIDVLKDRLKEKEDEDSN